MSYLTRVFNKKSKMIIRPSNLALRFYKRDGWTSDTLKEFMLPERPIPRFQEDPFDQGYWSILSSSYLNKEKVLKECEINHPFFWSDYERQRTQEQIFDDYS